MPDAPPALAAAASDSSADLVSWADGAPFDPGPVFDAGLEVPLAAVAYRRLDEAKTLATGWSGTILVAAIVRPRTVAEIDPAAAAAMAAGPTPRELVLYVRALETGYDPTRYPLGYAPPRLSWAVIDETTGVTLARGPAADPVFSRPRFPGCPSSAWRRRSRRVARASPPAWSPSRAGSAPGRIRGRAHDPSRASPVVAVHGPRCSWTGRGRIRRPQPPRTSGRTLLAPFPPGVLIPDRAVGLAVADLGPPPPVVVLGRFGPSDAGCNRDPRECAEPFTIEAVVWSSGRNLAPGRQVAAGLVAPIDLVAASVTDPGVGPPAGVARLLRVVLARATDLAALDPAAAVALRPAGLVPSTPVWYVRGLATDGAAISWAVVEPGTGRVLAREEAG